MDKRKPQTVRSVFELLIAEADKPPVDGPPLEMFCNRARLESRLLSKAMLFDRVAKQNEDTTRRMAERFRDDGTARELCRKSIADALDKGAAVLAEKIELVYTMLQDLQIERVARAEFDGELLDDGGGSLRSELEKLELWIPSAKPTANEQPSKIHPQQRVYINNDVVFVDGSPVSVKGRDSTRERTLNYIQEMLDANGEEVRQPENFKPAQMPPELDKVFICEGSFRGYKLAQDYRRK